MFQVDIGTCCFALLLRFAPLPASGGHYPARPCRPAQCAPLPPQCLPAPRSLARCALSGPCRASFLLFILAQPRVAGRRPAQLAALGAWRVHASSRSAQLLAPARHPLFINILAQPRVGGRGRTQCAASGVRRARAASRGAPFPTLAGPTQCAAPGVWGARALSRSAAPAGGSSLHFSSGAARAASQSRASTRALRRSLRLPCEIQTIN